MAIRFEKPKRLLRLRFSYLGSFFRHVELILVRGVLLVDEILGILKITFRFMFRRPNSWSGRACACPKIFFPPEYVTDWTKEHGRLVRWRLRRVSLSPEEAGLCGCWQFIAVWREQQKLRQGKVIEEFEEYSFYCTSAAPERYSAQELLGFIRGHWSASENGSHHRRDVSLGEDACQISTHPRLRGGHVAQSGVGALRAPEASCQNWLCSRICGSKWRSPAAGGRVRYALRPAATRAGGSKLVAAARPPVCCWGAWPPAAATSVVSHKRLDLFPFVFPHSGSSAAGLDLLERPSAAIQFHQRLRYSVSGGSPGNSLKEKLWYDPTGNVMKRQPAGTRQFEKFQFDAVGRETKRFRCYNLSEADTNYGAASSVANNTVQEQIEQAYDGAGNVTQVTRRERFHNATDAGELTTPGGAQPKARVYYTAIYPDGLGRTRAVAEYGTNGAGTFNRPATIPARSDTVLVTGTVYDDAGRESEVTDPKTIKNRTEYDAANRKTSVIENYVQSGSNPDQNRTTEMTWTADNQLKTLKAKNSETGDQTTTWVYGTTLSDSDVARNDLVRAKEFPDKSSASDRVEYKYNRLGEVKEIKDQIGTVRVLQYDKLGRELHDRVTTLGSGVDGAVRRISRTYDVRGLLAKLTSWNNATVGSGSIVNENEYAHNGFMQLTSEAQSHSGVVAGGTPKVQYAYTNGAANHARRTSITYPDTTVLALNYGSSGAVDDVLNRLKQLRFSSTVLVDYSYMGQGVPVIANYSSQPGVELTYFTSGGTGEGGDQYTGLDRFDPAAGGLG